ncbi:hypothetical protein HYW59_00295 [Candidatus Kaiserbacteria bacterium]|nr:hypothetical protein [Candidatus Kaiserbacteria bacterium]
MSESDGEGPKGPDRKNIRSIVDKIQRKKDDKKRTDDLEWRVYNRDTVDYQKFKDPERIRRKQLDAKASTMLDTLRADPAGSIESAIVALSDLQTQKVPPNYDTLVESLTHEQCVREPDKARAILDGYFKSLDELAARITDEKSAEDDITDRFSPKGLTPDEWARRAASLLDEEKARKSRDELGFSHPSERTSFEKQLESQMQYARLDKTESVVGRVRSYSLNEWGPHASYLLAVILEYRKRRGLTVEK